MTNFMKMLRKSLSLSLSLSQYDSSTIDRFTFFLRSLSLSQITNDDDESMYV